MSHQESPGLVWQPPGTDWRQTHAQNPFAQRINEDRLRIHFSCRDQLNRSRGAWIEVSSLEPFVIEETSVEPSLGLGRLGMFDDSGAMPSCIVENDGSHFLYYTGWSLGQTVPFYFYIGVAVSNDGGRSFRRYSEAPIIGREKTDPIMAGSPWVVKTASEFRLWYVSCLRWEKGPDGEVRHYYTIKHGTSADGLSWTLSEEPCLPLEREEHAIARPFVYFDNGEWHMIFSVRSVGEAYHIGYARSGDGLTWIRDQVFGSLSDNRSSWFSEMMCYGTLVPFKGATYLLFNGNGYGRHGFGIARVD